MWSEHVRSLVEDYHWQGEWAESWEMLYLHVVCVCTRGEKNCFENTHIHTHVCTHTHTNNKMDKCKELPHWVTPPQPKAGAPCATSGNSGPALDKLLKPGQVLAGALTVPSNYGVGTRSPTWTLVE